MAAPESVNEFAWDLDFCDPDNVKSVYATNTAIQIGEHEFVITFYEARPPILLGSPEEIRRQANGIKRVPARCVARVVIAKERVPGVLKLLQQQVERESSRHRLEPPVAPASE